MELLITLFYFFVERWPTPYSLEGKIIGVASSEVEILAIELEDAIPGGDEPGRNLASSLLRKSSSPSSQEADGYGADSFEYHHACKSIIIRTARARLGMIWPVSRFIL